MKMTAHRLLAAALLACADANASGGGGSWDHFVNRSIPDIALSRYQKGELGVVVNSYHRVYLYQAWRSVMLGADGLKAADNPADGLLRAAGNRNSGWSSSAEGAEAYKTWKASVAAALKRPLPVKEQPFGMDSGYLNCPISSYTFATSTLNDLVKRSDATPARLEAWVATQQQVFKFCGDDPTAPRSFYSSTKPVVSAPPPLPATEPLYWRQMQQYQLASAAFYGEDYALSGALFAQIGATDKHPLRAWGEYLSLRSQARAATYIPGSEQERWKIEHEISNEGPAAAAARLVAQQNKLAAVQASIAHIVANPELAPLHEASRAIGRAMQARLTPSLRFAELSKLLDDPAGNPYAEDHLGDWRVLANDLLQQPYGDKADLRGALRQSAHFIDWIQTVQQCTEYQAKTDCATERQHALEQWRAYRKEGREAMARSWLMAIAMLPGTLPPDVEQASLQVSASAPEYLTLRYALVRHYRLSKQAEKVRAISDAILEGPQLAATDSLSARNLFLEERFAAATSIADAAKYLMRTQSGNLDPDTGEVAATTYDRTDVASDGSRWLTSGLSAADLMVLSSNPQLPQQLRAIINANAWLRFDLLGREDAALAAAAKLEQLSPTLAVVAKKYRDENSAPERHYRLMIDAMRYNLSPVFRGYITERSLRSTDSTVADLWCKLPAKPGANEANLAVTEAELPIPELGNTVARNQELEKLASLKTATGYIGHAIMQRARTVPNDPELPWLLYVTVQSTRGGCLDNDAKGLSKDAFNLLHKRYGKTEWANRTPYYY